eukprot:s18_g33.t1
MAGLFRDEPDEDDFGCPPTFGQEPDEECRFVFQTEPEEPDCPVALFAAEKDEVANQPVSLSSGSESEDDTAYDADIEEDELLSRRRLFDMSFSTMNRFMAGQLCKLDESSSAQPAKKRCYNNTRRAAKAAAAKIPKTNSKRVPRDDPVSCIVELEFFIFKKEQEHTKG